jgi:HSP20 family protein
MTLIKFNKNANRGFAPVFPSLLNEMMEAGFSDLRLNNGGTALPAVNISESEKGFHIDLSIPGFGKEEITISLDENNLIVTGEKSAEKVDQEKRFTRKEFSYQNFKRSFTLPENVNEEAIAAKFENGILNLELPKKEHNQKVSRKIELQ